MFLSDGIPEAPVDGDHRVQQQLATLGLYTKKIDADYGNGTATASSALQKSGSLPQTGEIASMNMPIPSVEDRCLGLTAAFEGYGFTLAQGNVVKNWGIAEL